MTHINIGGLSIYSYKGYSVIANSFIEAIQLMGFLCE